VDLYVDWLLNSSIAEQFNAFRTGFDLVVNESPLTYLLHPHELELVIRGSEVCYPCYQFVIKCFIRFLLVSQSFSYFKSWLVYV